VTKQRESRLSQSIMRALRAQGIFCFKVHGSEHMMAGLPDIVACVEGKFLGLESKHPETREDTSPRQDLVHTYIEESGGTARVVCSVAEALEVVQELRTGG
jgi:Holliday junction resolvase